MSVRFRYVFIGLFLAALFLCGRPLPVVGRESPVEADSVLKTYLRQCRSHLNEPEGPAFCDTLFSRAEAAGNIRMQAIALCLRLDHYYFANDREEIVSHVKRVQDFCVRHGKKELCYYYYFVWSSRLVTFYIKQQQFNVAVYETRRMLSEAQDEEYMQGVADCYRLLANIYLSQDAHREAFESLTQCLHILESRNIEDVNLPTHYATLAQCAMELHMPDSAYVALRKADALPQKTNYQRFTVLKAFALYYIEKKDFMQAWSCLERCEELFRDDSAMRPYAPGLHYLRRVYYKATGQYELALDAVRRSQCDTLLHVTNYQYHSFSRDLGDIYWLMGDMKHSAESYRDYIRVADSVRAQEVRNATNDFSGILEVARLQTETKQLQLDLQRKRLHNTYSVIGLMGFLMLSGGFLYARTVKIARRLRASERRVLAQNEELRATGEELVRAREHAEEASRMKSDFIQNMSHEVRTPLNSIVGFSRIIASQVNSPDAREYADIIEQSSSDLMRLVDDVLDIAALDQTDELPRPDCCELVNRCRDCVDRMPEKVKPGVSVIFESGPDNPVVCTNARRIEQVLMHLLHNAAKFTEQGQITLRYDVLSEQGRLRFTVSDTGPGIAPRHREEVFERFVKLNAFSQGTGLGLPICRIIAEKLGGSLHVDPAYVRGCRMIFEVPYTAA